MSLVLSTSVKANVRLEQAVKQFEAILTPHQVTQFRSQRNIAITSPPTVIDVRTLLLDVDAIVLTKTSTRRAFSPRLSSVVETVQKFASIGDIIVGGSQNLIACGVWSIVRLALTLIATSLSTLERLSNFFMAIGRSAPRYEELALLYPQSERLQMYLCEYHILVVNLCRELVAFTQKSTVSLFVSSMNSSMWKTYQVSLEQWSVCIKEEVSSLMAKTVEHESSSNSIFRAFVTGEMRKDSLMKQLKARRKALDACTAYDYEATWRQQRKVGTTELFKDDEIYQRWKGATASQTLLVDGKIGSGKTVMLANIVDDLRRDAPKDRTNIAYFFFRHDMPESLKERVLFGSLVRELLRSVKNSFPWEEIAESLKTSTGEQSMQDILLQILPAETMTYFVIDGIDECNTQTVENIQKILKTVQLSRKLAICISYRTNSLPVALQFRLLNQSYFVMPENNSDINDYVSAELERRIELGHLALGDPELIKDIYTTLTGGAKGMFLWVALQIECLCSQKTDERIRSALTKLPESLPDLFARVLDDAAMRSDAKDDQARILELVVSAVRPLQEEEMREALSVEPGNTDWDTSKLPNDIRSLLACCGSLLIVDEEDRSIRLAHPSVLQYLMENYKRSNGTALTRYDAHRTFAAILITYLSYGIFETQVSRSVSMKLPMHAMQSTVVRSTINGGIKQKLALQILKSISRSEQDVGNAISQATNRTLESNNNGPIYFLHDYARKNLLAHIWVYINDIEDPMVSLLGDLLVRDNDLGNSRWQKAQELDLSTWRSEDAKGLALLELLWKQAPAPSSGFATIFQSAIPIGDSYPKTTFLVWACAEGHIKIVLRWLEVISEYRKLYPDQSYAQAISAALVHSNYDTALELARHIAIRRPKLAFLKSWLMDCKLAAAQIDVAQRHIECSMVLLDLLLDKDNMHGLQFLLYCDAIDHSRLELINIDGKQFLVSLLDRCIWKTAKDCLWLLQKSGFSSHIANLTAFAPEQTELRYRLLQRALYLKSGAICFALVEACAVEQKMDEDERLQCLHLAIKYNMIDIVRYMLQIQKWFGDGIERTLNPIHWPSVNAATVDSNLAQILRESNISFSYKEVNPVFS